MNHDCILVIPLVLVSMIASGAQHAPPTDFNPEHLADDVLPRPDDANNEEGYENLMQLLSEPLDLNKATGEQLRALLVLRDEQVESIIAYRRAHGPFLSVYELQAVPSLDISDCYRISPMVTVADGNSSIDGSLVRRILQERNGYFLSRWEQTLEEKEGYGKKVDSSRRYEGSPAKIYLRFRVSKPGDFSIGMTAEKDAGESWRWDPAHRYYGLDYYSFHSQLQNKGRLINLVIGDFQAQFGQGLILGGGFGMGKGAEAVTTIRRSNLGFVPYTSVNEFGFLRGCAISYALSKRMVVHALVSGLRRDALLHADSSVDESSLVSSFALTGYHRTPNERLTRKQIREVNLGLLLNYKHKTVDAGIVVLRTQYNLPLIRTPAVYNQFYFAGNLNTNVGIFLNWSKDNIAFFSEAVQTVGHGSAVTAGWLAGLSPRLDLSLLYRNFARDFHTFYTNAVSENTTPQNETGIYWGLKLTISKKYSASGFVDLFRFPWLRYRAYSPGGGSEWLVRLNYKPSRKTLVFVQAREEVKDRNLGGEGNFYKTGPGLKRSYWISCDYTSSSRWAFKTKAQFNSFKLAGAITKGMALMQDVSVRFGPFTIAGRFAVFGTDSFDNRIYTYERDAALAFSFPAYEGVGIRRLLMIQWRICRQVDLLARWAVTHLETGQTIGSGGETIAGNEKNDVKLQARIKF